MLEGRIAVVTGGGRGMGREHCLELARHGDPARSRTTRGSASTASGPKMRPADAVVDEITAAGGVAIADHSSVTDWQSCSRDRAACRRRARRARHRGEQRGDRRATA